MNSNLRNRIMSSFTRDPLPMFEERLERLCRRVGYERPVLHGQISIEVGCSLEQVSREMEMLLDAGKVRLVSPEELKARSLESRSIAYLLVR